MMDERVKKVLSGVFSSFTGKFLDEYGPQDITDWDSLNHLNLIMALNNEFGIEIGFEEMLEIQKVGDIKNILAKHGLE